MKTIKSFKCAQTNAKVVEGEEVEFLNSLHKGKIGTVSEIKQLGRCITLTIVLDGNNVYVGKSDVKKHLK